jgi:hypothetical protein
MLSPGILDRIVVAGLALVALRCGSAKHEDIGDVTYQHTGTLKCWAGCALGPPMVVGSQFEILVGNMTAKANATVRSSNPAVVSAEAKGGTLVGPLMECIAPACVTEPRILVAANSVGDARIQLAGTDGEVASEFTLSVHADAKVELALWNHGELSFVLDNGVPTWTLRAGDSVLIDRTMLDASGTTLIGEDALTLTSSSPDVFALAIGGYSGAALQVGRAELTVNSPSGEYRFAVNVVDSG